MIGISKTKIANMALSLLSVRSVITDLDEATVEARQARLWYDVARQQVLEAFDWNFARKRLLLATHTNAPPDGVWAYRYQYPADCIFFRAIETTNTTIDAFPFAIEIGADGSRSVLTDVETATGIYTANQENVLLFSPLFVQALSALLASYMAITLTGKAVIRDNMFNLYGVMLERAAVLNYNERISRAPREAESIRGRA